MSPLPPFAGGYNSYAAAANNRGQIVGWAEKGVFDPTCDPAYQLLQFRAVIWSANGQMQELPPLPGDYGLNEDGQIVGVARITGVGRRAVMWQTPVAAIQDLNELVPPGSPTLTIAADVNNGGRIAGYTESGLGFLAVPK